MIVWGMVASCVIVLVSQLWRFMGLPLNSMFCGLNKLKIMSDSKLAVDILNKSIACPWKVLTLVHDL